MCFLLNGRYAENKKPPTRRSGLKIVLFDETDGDAPVEPYLKSKFLQKRKQAPGERLTSRTRTNSFPRTCAGIAIESRVGDIEDDTHEVRIEGGPLIFQRTNCIQVSYSGG